MESHDDQVVEEHSKLKLHDDEMTPLNKMDAAEPYYKQEDENPRKRKLSFDDEVKPKRPLAQSTLDGRVIRETEVKKKKRTTKTFKEHPKSLQGHHLITNFFGKKFL